MRATTPIPSRGSEIYNVQAIGAMPLYWGETELTHFAAQPCAYRENQFVRRLAKPCLPSIHLRRYFRRGVERPDFRVLSSLNVSTSTVDGRLLRLLEELARRSRVPKNNLHGSSLPGLGG